MRVIPESHQDLLEDETKAFAFLATTMSDGTPQVTPVWFDTDGDRIRVNTARGRVKDLNMSRMPGIALAIIDPKNPYRYMQIRGSVIDITEVGGRAHIDRLAGKYRGVATYSGNPNETRVIYTIEPHHSSTMG